MTATHRVEAVLAEDGKLSLDHLPFQAGQAVEVIVRPVRSTGAAPTPPLPGTILRYDDPFEPVAEGDWSALQ